ncbi:MAG: ribonuclease P protein component [Negativicutes bacterium]|nr:ribonuclease P protein component [Negativicutes bacterium]
MDKCLPRQEIIRRKEELQDLYLNGGLIRDRLFVVRWQARPDGRRRVAFAAGRRLGGAVVRNRCRRLLRECYRRNKHLLPAGLDCLMIARMAMLGCPLAVVEAAWGRALKKLNREYEREGAAGENVRRAAPDCCDC